MWPRKVITGVCVCVYMCVCVSGGQACVLFSSLPTANNQVVNKHALCGHQTEANFPSLSGSTERTLLLWSRLTSWTVHPIPCYPSFHYFLEEIRLASSYTDSFPSPSHPSRRFKWAKLRSYKKQQIPESGTLLFFSPWRGTRVGPSMCTMGYVFSCFPTIGIYQLPLPLPGLYCQKPQGIILLLSYTFYPQHAKVSRDE